MRKVVFSLALLASFGIAHADSGNDQLFDCMDAQTDLVNVASESLGDYAIATMTFDQEKMHIDVVAHKESLNALAANRN